MAGFTNYLEDELLDHLLGGGDYSAPGTVYLALFTAAPTDAGGGTEATGGGYVRLAITNNPSNFPNASDGEKTNGVDFTMFTASGAVSAAANMTHVGLYDASSGGNLLMWAAVDTPAAIASGDTPTFATGALQFELKGAFGTSVRNGLLDLVLGANSYSRPASVYAALFTAAPSESGGGTEVSGGSYARVTIANNNTNFPASSSGTKTSGTAITFPTATAAWGTVTDFALFSSALGGSILYFRQLTVSRVVSSGQTFRVDAAALVPVLD